MLVPRLLLRAREAAMRGAARGPRSALVRASSWTPSQLPPDVPPPSVWQRFTRQQPPPPPPPSPGGGPGRSRFTDPSLWRWLAAMFAVPLYAYWSSTDTDRTPVTHRRRILLGSDEAVDAVADRIAAVLEENPRKLPPWDPRVSAVTAVGQRLAAAAAEVLSEDGRHPARAAGCRGGGDGGSSSGRGRSVEDAVVAGISGASGGAGADGDADADGVRAGGATAGSPPPSGPLPRAWRFFVIDDPHTENAASAPGNTLIIWTGLLDRIDKEVAAGKLRSREEALAAVLAHEMSHSAAGHPREGASQGLLNIWVAAMALAAPSRLGPLWMMLPAYDLVYNRPHRKAMELEADDIGLVLQQRACYDTSVAAAAYPALSYRASWAVQWLSDHPSDAERAARSTRLSARLQGPQQALCPDGLALTPGVEEKLTRRHRQLHSASQLRVGGDDGGVVMQEEEWGSSDDASDGDGPGPAPRRRVPVKS